jgi:hypothetical protein
MKRKVIIAVLILFAAASLCFTWAYLTRSPLQAESDRIEKLTPNMDLLFSLPPSSIWTWHGRIIAKEGLLFSIDCDGDSVQDFQVTIPTNRHYAIGEKVRGSVRFPFEDENNDPPFITGKE